MSNTMSDSEAGWLAIGGTALAALAAIIRTLKADPNKQLSADTERARHATDSALEHERLEAARDEQEAQQQERLLPTVMAWLREEQAERKKLSDIVDELREEVIPLRGEVKQLRADVKRLTAELHDKEALRAECQLLRKELEDTRQLLATYRAKEHP
jgi:predicted RNase H-like nuclease (RuvC/YqgF family)